MYMYCTKMSGPLAITRETQVAWHVRHKEYLKGKMWHCAVCNSDMKLANMCNHKRTKKHQMREHLLETGEALSYPNKAETQKYCEACQFSMHPNSYYAHVKTKRHLENVAKVKPAQP
jgi:hypothetical protein